MNPWDIPLWEMAARLGLALLLGGLIGIERERSNRAAGLRTNILVCVGSTLIMLLSMYGFSQFAGYANMDPARLAAQVVSGIGFLGAGVILFNGFSVTGLTTAATLWVLAGIGLAVGAGFYIPAVITTLIVLFSLLTLNRVEERWFHAKAQRQIRMTVLDQPGNMTAIFDLFREMGLDSRRVEMERTSDAEQRQPSVSIALTVHIHKERIPELIEQLSKRSEISDVAVE